MEISLREPNSGQPYPVVEGGAHGTLMIVSRSFAEVYPFYKLAGQTAAATLATLREAVQRLGTERDVDYNEPSEGNVGHVCSLLVEWAERHPAGVWEVT
ncbi:MAG: hypothetical protein AMXMBFR61_16420 [Fimbriimonadales bacterium]